MLLDPIDLAVQAATKSLQESRAKCLFIKSVHILSVHRLSPPVAGSGMECRLLQSMNLEGPQTKIGLYISYLGGFGGCAVVVCMHSWASVLRPRYSSGKNHEGIKNLIQ